MKIWLILKRTKAHLLFSELELLANTQGQKTLGELINGH